MSALLEVDDPRELHALAGCRMEAVYDQPLQPDTRLEIACLPSFEQKGVCAGIPGLPPSLLNPPAGCHFNPRCPYVMDRCRIARPVLQPDRWVACGAQRDGAAA
jgi:oligopeptide/dipeptide ABC transporter ATP-binding protein